MSCGGIDGVCVLSILSIWTVEINIKLVVCFTVNPTVARLVLLSFAQAETGFKLGSGEVQPWRFSRLSTDDGHLLFRSHTCTYVLLSFTRFAIFLNCGHYEQPFWACDCHVLHCVILYFVIADC